MTLLGAFIVWVALVGLTLLFFAGASTDLEPRPVRRDRREIERL